MARLMLAWEMGSGMGHLDRMLVTARALRQRGHTVVFVLRDLSRAHPRVAAEGFEMLQAPVWLPSVTRAPRLGNYATVLVAAGWLDPAGLAALLGAWRALMQLWRADGVVCDHAPTATLAARGLGLRHWLVGNNFEVPPLGPHFPPMAHWLPGGDAACPGWDAQVLAPTNAALALLGLAPLPRLTALFDQAVRANVSLPELCHYPDTEGQAPVLGPVFADDVGPVAPWPAGDGPRVFAYLAPADARFEPVLKALHAAGTVALVHAKGVHPDAARRLGATQMRIEPEPVRVDAALASADLVVTHASIGTVTAAVLAGRPQLVLPRHMEQAMVAWRVARAGIGLVLEPGEPAADPLPLLRQLLDEPGWRARAQALAQQHHGMRPGQTGDKVADLIEAGLR
ncbi:MAG: udp-glucuronosyltransferase [Rubrivivax sp.]|nr:udp-glucuronosyltransferase [Rubrivivax sp.]